MSWEWGNLLGVLPYNIYFPEYVRSRYLAKYFECNESMVATGTADDHASEVLEVLNKGSMRELQILPGIGPKTAYQIILIRWAWRWPKESSSWTLEDAFQLIMFLQFHLFQIEER